VLSARAATGYYVVAALSSGNLLAVAKGMRKRYPTAALVVLADLVRDAGLPDPHAGGAARAVGGRVAVPDFGENRPHWASDFNDMAKHLGSEAVAECIHRQIQSGQVLGGQADRELGRHSRKVAVRERGQDVGLVGTENW
jgi:putative DNA primase/helicase